MKARTEKGSDMRGQREPIKQRKLMKRRVEVFEEKLHKEEKEGRRGGSYSDKDSLMERGGSNLNLDTVEELARV